MPELFAKESYKKAAIGRINPMAVAHHEAGHTVAGHLVGGRSAGASIVLTGFNSGSNVVTLPASAPDMTLDQATLLLVGGPVAEAIFAGTRNWKGASGDLAAAFRNAEAWFDDSTEVQTIGVAAYLWKQWAAAEQLLRKTDNWRAISSLARLLLSRETLSGRRVESHLREYGLRRVHPRALDSGTKARGSGLNQGRKLEDLMVERIRNEVRLGRLSPEGAQDIGAFRLSWRSSATGRVRVNVKEPGPHSKTRRPPAC